MSSSQAIDHDNKEGEEKNKNSLFQTELTNPIISSSEQTEKEKNKTENEKKENENSNQIDKIGSDLLKNEISNPNNEDSKKEIDTSKDKNLKNENEDKNPTQDSTPPDNEPDIEEDEKEPDLTQLVISINDQLTQKEDKPSPKSSKSETRAKTSNTNRNKNKKYSYLQEINSIPDSVKYNKYVENRYELYTGVKKAPKIPKAAQSKKEYNSKEIPQLDDLTSKLLDGDEEVIKKIKNSRKINPNLNSTTTTTNKSIDKQKINNKKEKKFKNSSEKTTNNNKNNFENSTEKPDNNTNINDAEISNNNLEENKNENPEENKNENLDENKNENLEENTNENVAIEEEENDENKSNYDDENDDDDNLPTLDDLKRTASQLRDYERGMISRGNYADAKKASQTLKMVNKEIYKQEVFSKNKGSIEQMVSKRNELNALLNSTKEEFDIMLIDHEQNTISKLDQIALQQKQELEEFDKNIPKDLPPLFKRNSVSYLKMRSKEKYLAITRNFDEAMNLQKKADVIEKEEEQLNFEKMDSYYRDKRKKLIIKQKNAIENYIQYSDMRKNEMLNLREVAIRGTINRIKNLETQIRIECNKRGIKQSEINYDIVDDERIELIKSKENENPISYKRAANSKLQKRNQRNSTAATSTCLSSSSLSKRNSVTNSQSSLASINSQSKRKSSLSSNKPKIKTPSSLSNSPLSSSVGSKRPTKPKKTAINQTDKKYVSPLNKAPNEIEKVDSDKIDDGNKKSEVGVNTKIEDELKINAQVLSAEISETSPKKD